MYCHICQDENDKYNNANLPCFGLKIDVHRFESAKNLLIRKDGGRMYRLYLRFQPF